MKRADWVRPLLEMLEGQARRAGQTGLSSGQKALATHLFDIIVNEVSCLNQKSHDWRWDCPGNYIKPAWDYINHTHT